MANAVGCVRCFSAILKGGHTVAEAVDIYTAEPVTETVLVYGGKSYCLQHYVEKVKGEKPWKVEKAAEKFGATDDTDDD